MLTIRRLLRLGEHALQQERAYPWFGPRHQGNVTMRISAIPCSTSRPTGSFRSRTRTRRRNKLRRSACPVVYCWRRKPSLISSGQSVSSNSGQRTEIYNASRTAGRRPVPAEREPRSRARPRRKALSESSCPCAQPDDRKRPFKQIRSSSA